MQSTAECSTNILNSIAGLSIMLPKGTSSKVNPLIWGRYSGIYAKSYSFKVPATPRLWGYLLLSTLTNFIETVHLKMLRVLHLSTNTQQLWKRKILYRIRNFPAIRPHLELHKFSPVQPPCFVKISVNVTLHFTPKPSQRPVPSCLPSKLCMSLSFFHKRHMPSASYAPWFDHLVIFGERNANKKQSVVWHKLTLRRLMSYIYIYIYIWSTYSWCF